MALSGVELHARTGGSWPTAVSVAGSDWQTWKVRDVATGKDLADEIQWSKFSGASWIKDGSGFYYSRYDAPKEGGALTGVNNYQQALLPQARHAAVRGRARLRAPRPARSGTSAAASPTTAAGWSSPCGKGTDPETSLFLQGSEQAWQRRGTLPRHDATPPTASWTTTATGSSSPPTRTPPATALVAIRKGQTDPAPGPRSSPRPRARTCWKPCRLVGGRFVATWMRDAHSAVDVLRPQGQADRRPGPARPRHRRRLRRPARRHRDLLHLHQLHLPGRPSTATT